MRIGSTTAAFYGREETEDAAGHLARLGVECCEVFLETYSEYSAAFGAEVAARLGRTQAVSIHCKTQHFESDFMGQSKRQREDAFLLLDGFLSAGEALGAEVYVYHGPGNVRGFTPDFARWQEGIARAISLAAVHGIALCWETVSWCHLNSPDRVKQFMDLWPALGFVLDIKQVHQLGQDPLAYIDAMGDRLRHVHVLDWDESGRLTLPGKGVYDFRALSPALRASGYAGDIILEPYASLVSSDQALLDSIAWLGDVFGA